MTSAAAGRPSDEARTEAFEPPTMHRRGHDRPIGSIFTPLVRANQAEENARAARPEFF